MSRYNPIARDNSSERWVVGAFVLAMMFHLMAAVSFGWIQIPHMAVLKEGEKPQELFVYHDVHLAPEATKPTTIDPMDLPPSGTGTPSQNKLDLDSHFTDKVRQQPVSDVVAPQLPDPQKAINDMPMPGVPFGNDPNSPISVQTSPFQETPLRAQSNTLELAQNIVKQNIGPAQAGDTAGSHAGGESNGTVPGFLDIKKNFTKPEVTNLPQPALIRLPADVLFDFDRSILRPEANNLLKEAADFITKYPQASVYVDGYTDSFGQSDYNQKLSQARAQAVVDWLQQNVPQGSYNFHAKGHGGADYVVDPKGSKEQQESNRRVELLVQALKT